MPAGARSLQGYKAKSFKFEPQTDLLTDRLIQLFIVLQCAAKNIHFNASDNNTVFTSFADEPTWHGGKKLVDHMAAARRRLVYI